MKVSFRLVLALSSVSFASVEHAFAEGAFEYPELMVTPRASQRLEDEQKKESARAWANYLPFQISALSTFAVGMMASSDPGKPRDGGKELEQGEVPESKTAGTVARVVGGGWFGVTLALSALYRPYKQGYAAISSMPAKTKREILARERAAEEYIQAPASLMTKMKWLSVVTNAAASGYAASTVKEENPKVYGALAAAIAFAPLMFENHYETVGHYQRDYKKRIYGPVATVDYIRHAKSERYDPSLSLTWLF